MVSKIRLWFRLLWQTATIELIVTLTAIGVLTVALLAKPIHNIVVRKIVKHPVTTIIVQQVPESTTQAPSTDPNTTIAPRATRLPSQPSNTAPSTQTPNTTVTPVISPSTAPNPTVPPTTSPGPPPTIPPITLPVCVPADLPILGCN